MSDFRFDEYLANERTEGIAMQFFHAFLHGVSLLSLSLASLRLSLSDLPASRRFLQPKRY